MGLDNKDKKKIEKFSPKDADDRQALKKAKAKEATDWLGLAVIVSAVIIGGFFILGSIDAFNTDNETQEEAKRVKAEYQKNVADPNNTPEAVYEQARQALLNNDLEGVLETIHPEVMWKYEESLQAAAADGNLNILGERLTPLQEVVSEYGNVIRYSQEPIPGSEQNDNPLDGYSESVEFTRDHKGVWKISSI